MIKRLDSIKALLFVFIALSLTGCARSAPDLPPDTSGKSPKEAASLLGISQSDFGLGCVEIINEKENLTRKHDIEEATIRSNRTNNQVAGYFGTFFPPAYLATESNSASKDRLDSIQLRFDQLYFLGQLNNCKRGDK